MSTDCRIAVAEQTRACCLVMTCIAMIAGSAVAQQPPARPPATRPAPSPVQNPAPSPVQNEAPQRTTATYDDWVVECQTQTGSSPEKVCDMAQVTQMQGRNIPFSRVAIARPAKASPVKLVVQVPVYASFQTNVRIQTSDSDAGLAVPFARCMPTGCFADFDLKDDVLKKFRAASNSGKLSFADASGHDVSVPLSFKGFGQAFDALVKE